MRSTFTRRIVSGNIIAIAFFLLPTVSFGQKANATDSLALVDLYNNTGGAKWFYNPGWLSGPVSTWAGVSLDANGYVTTLNLGSDGLKGTLPSSIGNFANLTSLDLSNNQLSGNIPGSITNLAHLTNLLLNNNSLTGAIPANIGNLTSLQNLKLAYNGLTGSIASSIGSIVMLQDVELNNNQLTDSIPWAISSLKCGILLLNNNRLTGKIPPGLGNMISLLTLDLSYNQLTDTIPASMGQLTYLSGLNLNNNSLTGKVPAALGNINYSNNFSLPGYVRGLNLANNKLTFSGMDLLLQTLANNGYTVKVTYAPQDTILPLHFGNGRLNVSAGGLLTNNIYKWYNGSTLAATINGDSTFVPPATGNYTVTVNNTVASQLSLQSGTFAITMPTDSLALVDLYYHTDGPHWTNKSGWLSGPLKSWHGISVDNLGNVTGISLAENGLRGNIPISLSNITGLKQLNISNNYFTFNTAEWVAHQFSFATYAPQDTILPLTVSLGSISVSAGGTLGNNVYKWYNGGTLVKTSTGDSTLLTVAPGNYSVVVTNAIAGGLSLFSNTVQATLTATTLDSLSLVALYNSTGGINWTNHTNWLTQAPVGSWYGITINASGRVTQINLSGNNLTGGNITDSLNLLTAATLFNFSHNSLTGFLTALTALPSSLQIDLSYNLLDFGIEPLVEHHWVTSYPQSKGLPFPYSLNTTKDSITFYPQEYSPSGLIIASDLYRIEDGKPVFMTSNVLDPTASIQLGPITIPYVAGIYYAWMVDDEGDFAPGLWSLYFNSDTVVVGQTENVSLINFQGNISHNQALLTWQTASETDANKFNIQRSNDGQSFNTVGTVAAVGNSSILQSYQYTDGLTGLPYLPPTLYYRLEEIDKNGYQQYSKIINLNTGVAGKPNVLIYPNPAKEILHVALNNMAGTVAITVTGATGKTILTKQFNNGGNGSNIVTLSTSALPAGIYFLKVQNGQSIFLQKVIKQ